MQPQQPREIHAYWNQFFCFSNSKLRVYYNGDGEYRMEISCHSYSLKSAELQGFPTYPPSSIKK